MQGNNIQKRDNQIIRLSPPKSHKKQHQKYIYSSQNQYVQNAVNRRDFFDRYANDQNRQEQYHYSYYNNNNNNNQPMINHTNLIYQSQYVRNNREQALNGSPSNIANLKLKSGKRQQKRSSPRAQFQGSYSNSYYQKDFNHNNKVNFNYNYNQLNQNNDQTLRQQPINTQNIQYIQRQQNRTTVRNCIISKPQYIYDNKANHQGQIVSYQYYPRQNSPVRNTYQYQVRESKLSNRNAQPMISNRPISKRYSIPDNNQEKLAYSRNWKQPYGGQNVIQESKQDKKFKCPPWIWLVLLLLLLGIFLLFIILALLGLFGSALSFAHLKGLLFPVAANNGLNKYITMAQRDIISKGQLKGPFSFDKFDKYQTPIEKAIFNPDPSPPKLSKPINTAFQNFKIQLKQFEKETILKIDQETKKSSQKAKQQEQQKQIQQEQQKQKLKKQQLQRKQKQQADNKQKTNLILIPSQNNNQNQKQKQKENQKQVSSQMTIKIINDQKLQFKNQISNLEFQANNIFLNLKKLQQDKKTGNKNISNQQIEGLKVDMKDFIFSSYALINKAEQKDYDIQTEALKLRVANFENQLQKDIQNLEQAPSIQKTNQDQSIKKLQNSIQTAQDNLNNVLGELTNQKEKINSQGNNNSQFTNQISNQIEGVQNKVSQQIKNIAILKKTVQNKQQNGQDIYLQTKPSEQIKQNIDLMKNKFLMIIAAADFLKTHKINDNLGQIQKDAEISIQDLKDQINNNINDIKKINQQINGTIMTPKATNQQQNGVNPIINFQIKDQIKNLTLEVQSALIKVQNFTDNFNGTNQNQQQSEQKKNKMSQQLKQLSEITALIVLKSQKITDQIEVKQKQITNKQIEKYQKDIQNAQQVANQAKNETNKVNQDIANGITSVQQEKQQVAKDNILKLQDKINIFVNDAKIFKQPGEQSQQDKIKKNVQKLENQSTSLIKQLENTKNSLSGDNTQSEQIKETNKQIQDLQNTVSDTMNKIKSFNISNNQDEKNSQQEKIKVQLDKLKKQSQQLIQKINGTTSSSNPVLPLIGITNVQKQQKQNQDQIKDSINNLQKIVATIIEQNKNEQNNQKVFESNQNNKEGNNLIIPKQKQTQEQVKNKISLLEQKVDNILKEQDDLKNKMINQAQKEPNVQSDQIKQKIINLKGQIHDSIEQAKAIGLIIENTSNDKEKQQLTKQLDTLEQKLKKQVDLLDSQSSIDSFDKPKLSQQGNIYLPENTFETDGVKKQLSKALIFAKQIKNQNQEQSPQKQQILSTLNKIQTMTDKIIQQANKNNLQNVNNNENNESKQQIEKSVEQMKGQLQKAIQNVQSYESSYGLNKISLSNPFIQDKIKDLKYLTSNQNWYYQEGARQEYKIQKDQEANLPKLQNHHKSKIHHFLKINQINKKHK